MQEIHTEKINELNFVTNKNNFPLKDFENKMKGWKQQQQQQQRVGKNCNKNICQILVSRMHKEFLKHKNNVNSPI